jgi:hypothetical protein
MANDRRARLQQPELPVLSQWDVEMGPGQPRRAFSCARVQSRVRWVWTLRRRPGRNRPEWAVAIVVSAREPQQTVGRYDQSRLVKAAIQGRLAHEIGIGQANAFKASVPMSRRARLRFDLCLGSFASLSS